MNFNQAALTKSMNIWIKKAAKIIKTNFTMERKQPTKQAIKETNKQTKEITKVKISKQTCGHGRSPKMEIVPIFSITNVTVFHTVDRFFVLSF